MAAERVYESPEVSGAMARALGEVKHGENVTLTEDGLPFARITPIDRDEAWFWKPQFQAEERQRQADEAAGRGLVGPMAEAEFFDWLDGTIAQLNREDAESA